MNRFPLVVAALLAAATVSSQAQQIPDPRIADLVQAGKSGPRCSSHNTPRIPQPVRYAAWAWA